MSASIVHIVHLDETGDSKYRMLWPAQALAANNSSWSVCNIDAGHPDRYEYAKKADLLVLFNCADLDFLSVIAERQKRGRKTLVEYNDNFYEPQPWSPIAKEWGSWQIHQVYELFMQAADGIIVTGLGLEKLFGRVTDKPIFIIENILPFISENLAEDLKSKKPDSFGWAGSLGHIADILSVTEVIQSILQQNPSQTFYVMGNESLSSILNLPAERYKHVHWGSIEQYYEFLKGIQIGLIPMLDTAYNQCRSDIKIIEMLAAGVIPVVPELLPYQKLIKQFSLPSYSDLDSLQRTLQKTVTISSEDSLQILEPAYEWIRLTRVSNYSERQKLYEQFLPVVRDEAWKMPVGYHHLAASQASKSTELKYVTDLKKVQALQKLGNTEVAMEQMERLYNESPHHPEICYTYILNVLQSDKKMGEKLLQEAIEKFPKDIRFRLQFVSLTGSLSERVSEWRKVLLFLREQPQTFLRSARELVAKTLAAHLKHPLFGAELEFFNVVEEFLLLFPFSYSLRFALAEAYEKKGEMKEARGHFSALMQARRQFDEGTSEIANLDYGYLAAWYEACDKRLKRKLK